MNKILLLAAVLALGASYADARSLVNTAGVKTPYGESGIHVDLFGGGKNASFAARAGETVDELLACPENSVLSGEYSSSAGYTGSQISDQGRPGLSSKFYQSFTGCEYVVNGVRFLGIFNYYNETDGWVSCNDRGGINDKYEMTEPIRLEVSFYKEKDGMPGDLVYTETVDVKGEYTGVSNGDEPIFAFTIPLKQEVKMFSGFVSYSAVDMGDNPSCWLSVFTNSNVPGVGFIEMKSEEGSDWMQAQLSSCYCLLGDKNKFVAQKALALNRILSPTATSNQKYTKVQVEVQNVGKDDISDGALELWSGNTKLATENIGVTLVNGESYKYTFATRVDCSELGDHEFTVKNATADDSQVGTQSLTVTARNSDGACESKSESADSEYLTRVKIGDIDNASEKSNYSDFRDKKTNIAVGETLPLTVEYKAYSGDLIKVWVDWNGNGSFSESGEFLGYYTDDKLDVKIPEGAEVTAGDHCMRIIICYGDEQPCGTYQFGETEDYTLTVVRSADAPAMEIDKKDIEKTVKAGSTTSELIALTNDGGVPLTANVAVEYALPYSPNTKPVTQRVKPDFKLKQSAAKARVATKAPKADDAQFVLRYDRDYLTSLGLESGNEVTFATYYPGNTLAAIAGMAVSSVDVWVQDVPEKISIVVYGAGTQAAPGEIVATKEFTPTEAAWNHVVLDKPVSITNQDMWIGVKFEGLKAGSSQAGVDAGPAVTGFGDLVNVGGKTWWALADLGNDTNICLHANVTGERTPAINWLSVDKSSVDVAAGTTESVGLSLNTNGLDNTLYEAVLKVSSNDPITSSVKIPVYLTCGDKDGGISANEMITAKVYVGSDKTVTVESDKEVSYILATDINGHFVGMTEGTRLNLSDVQRGIYLVKVVYADGSDEATTVAIR